MRIKFILLLFALIWVALLVRIFYLSVQSNAYYDALSDNNTIRSEMITPIRGNIFDRNGNPIAINKLGFKIVLEPHLSEPAERSVLEQELKTLISYLPSLDYDDMLKRYLKKDSYYNHHFISIADFISYEEILPVFSFLNLREKIRNNFV